MHIERCLVKNKEPSQQHVAEKKKNQTIRRSDTELFDQQQLQSIDIEVKHEQKISNDVLLKGGISSENEPMRCPLCSLRLWNDDSLNNLHIDSCLNKSRLKRDALPPKIQKSVNDSSSEDKYISDKDNESTDSAVVNISGEILRLHGMMFRITHVPELPGLWLIYDFISDAEESTIIKLLNEQRCDDDNEIVTSSIGLEKNMNPWKHSSFNGHCLSQCFGVKTQFGLPDELRLVRENDNSLGEPDMPPFFQHLVDRLQQIVTVKGDMPSDLRGFRPNECNANLYIKKQGHYLRPHFDDRALSGPILMNLSLGGTVKMTYCIPPRPNATTPNLYDNGKSSGGISITLPPRCLQLVTGSSRYTYTHEIRPHHLLSPVRLSITWRQSGGKKKVAAKVARVDQNIIAKMTGYVR